MGDAPPANPPAGDKPDTPPAGDKPDTPPAGDKPEAPPAGDKPAETPPAAPGGTATPKPGGSPPVPFNDTHYFPIVIMTGIVGALFIIVPLLVRKGPNRGVIRCSIMLSLFCIWIFWVTIYISQMNPIMGPRLHNTTLAWLTYKIDIRKVLDSLCKIKTFEHLH